MNLGAAMAAGAFAVARYRHWRLRDRAAILRFHQRRLGALQAHAAARFAFYAGCANRPFADWPQLDKQTLLDHFADLNIARVGAKAVAEALARGEDRLSGLAIGQSTGTSGRRGYYVISDAERFVWLGTILSKTLPDALWRRHRVALALPGLSSLYQSASEGGRIALGFFDLARGVEAWADDLNAFRPDTLVAPPKVLRWLAERGKLSATRLFSGAETLDPLDREIIEAASGEPLREIYMATEGLFGVSCERGVLHLAEDVVHFEWAPAGGALVKPVVTDFTRRAQAMIRFAMNDLLELDDQPCLCGSAFQAVRRIHGRQDDCLWLPDASGALRMATPDLLRNAVVDAHASIRDFRIVQTAPDVIELFLAVEAAPEADAAASAALSQRFVGLGVTARIVVRRGITTPFDRKLRRVRRGDWA